jgi:hypothetical protein
MTTATTTTAPRGRLRTARSRGAVTGLLLLALGVWGALVPFVGPHWHFGFTPDTTWTWTAARFWLEVLPGAATAVAGLVVMVSANRVLAQLATWVALAAGLWFVVGPLIIGLFSATFVGTPVGGSTRVAAEQIAMFYGLGAVISALASFASGRFSVVGVRDVVAAERRHRARAIDLTEPAPAAAPSDPEITHKA